MAQETQALIAAARGDAARADSLLASVERDAVQFASPAMMQIVVHARGSGALSAGRHDEAFAQLRRLNDPSDPSFHPVGQGWAVADLAEAAIGSGHVDDVRPIVAELERVGRRCRHRGSTSGCVTPGRCWRRTGTPSPSSRPPSPPT